MAPIFVTDYTWTQTKDTVNILVPIKISSRKDVDIFTCSAYLKINASPFLFEIFLNSEIDEERSKCSFAENLICFDLIKLEPKEWPQLTADVSKEEKVFKRQQMVAKKHEKDAIRSKELSKKQHELSQFAIQKQIGLGSACLQKVEDLKSEEKEKVSRELEEWKKESFQDGKCSKKINFVENSIVCKEGCNNEAEMGKIEIFQTSEKMEEATKVSRCRALLPSSTSQELKKKHELAAVDDFPIPRPRAKARIEVNFSAREFPTPTRESQLQEEQEWLKKQFEARKASGFVAEDLRPEECDPVWLKNKGDAFYSHNNFLGAISAYSHAIKIGSKMPGLYSNRSAAHFQLGNLHKALEDCSTALELLTPHVSANEEARFTCHVRRAAILWRLGLPEKAIPDYETALKLRPNDDQVRADYNRAKAVVDELEESD